MAYIYYYDKFFDNVYLAALAVFSAFVVVNVMVVKYLLARRNKKFVLLAVSFISAGLSFLVGIWIGLICLSVFTLVEFMFMLNLYYVKLGSRTNTDEGKDKKVESET